MSVQIRLISATKTVQIYQVLTSVVVTQDINSIPIGSPALVSTTINIMV